MVPAMSSTPAWSPPPPEQPAASPPADVHEKHEHGRLALFLALSIAVVSVLGAVVGWRAEVHASSASRYEQDAVAASITATQLHSDAEAQAAAAQSNYEHYRRLGEEADRLVADPCPVDNPTTLIELNAEAACAMQPVFAGYDDPAYVKNGAFDV